MDALALQRVLSSLAPNGFAAKVEAIDGSHEMHPEEEDAVRSAVAGRRREFAAGRAAARAALAAAGGVPQAIPRAPDRRPIWPEGMVGSLSHSQGFAAALAGPAAAAAGVGLDIEGAEALPERLRRGVLTPAEMRVRDARPMAADTPRCKITFAAKEALFKAVHPITGVFFGFMAAKIDVGEDGAWRPFPTCLLYTSPSPRD